MDITYSRARAVRIYQNPYSIDVRADVLFRNGKMAHYDWLNRSDRDKIHDVVDSDTTFYDERAMDVGWENLCGFYGVEL